MKLILACDPKGGIGYQNRLPWDKIQGDLPRFKSLTMNNPIVMGRNTWESLPKKPLPNRLNIIISSNEFEPPNGAMWLPNLTHYEIYKDAGKDSWLIGGAKLINSSWHLIDEIHLTKTFAIYTCDTFIDLSYINANFTCMKSEMYDDHSYEVWTRVG
jgi:dihydrofolate reductase